MKFFYLIGYLMKCFFLNIAGVLANVQVAITIRLKTCNKIILKENLEFTVMIAIMRIISDLEV